LEEARAAQAAEDEIKRLEENLAREKREAEEAAA